MSHTKYKLVSHHLCPYVQRARIVLAEKSIPYDVELIDLANRPGWFNDISPLGKVPLLMVDGRVLFESAVIVDYLDDVTPNSLYPADHFEKAMSRAWVEFASSILNTIASFYNAPDIDTFENARDLLSERFITLERALGPGPWFNGSDFSPVDAAFGPVFRYFDLFERYVDFSFFDGLPGICTWRANLSGRDSVRLAIVDDFYERLHLFLVGRESVLSRVINGQRAA